MFLARNTLCAQNAEFFNVVAGGTYSNFWAILSYGVRVSSLLTIHNRSGFPHNKLFLSRCITLIQLSTSYQTISRRRHTRPFHVIALLLVSVKNTQDNLFKGSYAIEQNNNINVLLPSYEFALPPC